MIIDHSLKNILESHFFFLSKKISLLLKLHKNLLITETFLSYLLVILSVAIKHFVFLIIFNLCCTSFIFSKIQLFILPRHFTR